MQQIITRPLEDLINRSLDRPQRNIHGDLGPRCTVCSGLGSYLDLKGTHELVRSTTKCQHRCMGSGIDLPTIERYDRDAMWHQIQAIESRLGLPISSRYQLPSIEMSRQQWMECIAWATQSGAAVASTASETILFPNVTIPANYMQDGRGLRLKFNFKWSTTTGTVTHIYQVRWGGVSGTTICKTGTVTLLVSITNGYGEVEAEIITQSNGSSGTLMGNGFATIAAATAPTIGSATGAPATAPLTAGGQTAPAAATVDLTSDTALSVTIQHGASSASNTATGLQYVIESKN